MRPIVAGAVAGVLALVGARIATISGSPSVGYVLGAVVASALIFGLERFGRSRAKKQVGE